MASPVFFYAYFERVDLQSRGLVSAALRDRDEAIAQALSALLLRTDALSSEALEAALVRSSKRPSRHWILHSSMDVRSPQGVQVAAITSWIPAQKLDDVLDESTRRLIVDQLRESCVPSAEHRTPALGSAASPAISPRISIVPIPAVQGCWLLVSADFAPNSPAAFSDRSFWQIPQTRFAAGAYLLLAMVALLLVTGIVRSLRRFCEAAEEVGQRRSPGSMDHIRGTVDHELARAKNVLEGLVLDIRRIAAQIRLSAEDNSHSFRSALAVVRIAVVRIRRNVPTTQDNIHRALQAADQAIDRLLLLVTVSHKIDDDTAALIVAPRHPVDLRQLIDAAARQFRDLMDMRQIRLVRRLDGNVVVQASAGTLETVLRNIIDNAITTSPDGGAIVITLRNLEDVATLQVDDDGQGVPSGEIDRVFARDYPGSPGNIRTNAACMPDHARPGLFIVKRNIDSLGGTITAANRPEGGFSVSITLPRPRC